MGTKRKTKNQVVKELAVYSQSPTSKLPGGFYMRNGFIMKNDTIIGLNTPGIVEATGEGSIHVDEEEKYITG